MSDMKNAYNEFRICRPVPVGDFDEEFDISVSYEPHAWIGGKEYPSFLVPMEDIPRVDCPDHDGLPNNEGPAQSEEA